MLPDMHDNPPEIPKLSVFAAIPGNVLVELRSPPLGVVLRRPWSGQRCQKHPSTNMAIRARVNAMSGVPGRVRR